MTPDGWTVQGYTQVDPATGEIVTTGSPTDITVPPGVLRAPVATTTFRTLTNLDAVAAAGGSTFTTSVQIYDSLGSAHVVTVTYTKTGPGAWSYEMTVPGADVTGGTAGTPFSPGRQRRAGTLTFDTDGKLTTVNGGAPADVDDHDADLDERRGRPTSSLGPHGRRPGAVAHGYYARRRPPRRSPRTARPPGMIQNRDHRPTARSSRPSAPARPSPIGQLALANFNNPKGLVKLGSNRYGESQAAGIANVGTAGTGGRGTLIGSALEQSNVDIAQEFTQMILAQRGYQANSKTITVSDELLVETLNLKR